MTSQFVYDLGSSREGAIVYPLPSLGFGDHSISVAASDNMGNRSSRTLQFEIVSAADFSIRNVANHPNPFPNGGDGRNPAYCSSFPFRRRDDRHLHRGRKAAAAHGRRRRRAPARTRSTGTVSTPRVTNWPTACTCTGSTPCRDELPGRQSRGNRQSRDHEIARGGRPAIRTVSGLSLKGDRNAMTRKRLPIALILVAVFAMHRRCPGIDRRSAVALHPARVGARRAWVTAYVAIADDASAVSWNPAGLAFLEDTYNFIADAHAARARLGRRLLRVRRVRAADRGAGHDRGSLIYLTYGEQSATDA